ncbi:MAG: hypothetical protein GMKNLPBB_00366 [Myxococcota bacterium]|nr:hypothetical protein [Myxococcota bacterium]
MPNTSFARTAINALLVGIGAFYGLIVLNEFLR